MKDNEFWAAVGKFLIGAALFVVCIVADAWALTILWRWFVMPVFLVRSIVLAEAAGISTLATFLFQTHVDEKQEWGLRFFMGIFRPVFFVVFGWVIHLFM